MENKYVNGYLNYAGSKYGLISQLIENMDFEKKFFADIFCGSMVITANVIDKFDRILVNDILKDVVGIHKGVLNSDEFIEETKKLCNVKDDQEAYLKLRESYNNDKTPEKLWALILSCNSNLMRHNSSGNFNQTWGKRQWNENTDKKVKAFIEHVRPYKDKIIFMSKHFNDIKITKPTMVYLDPPYSSVEDKNGKITNESISEAG